MPAVPVVAVAENATSAVPLMLGALSELSVTDPTVVVTERAMSDPPLLSDMPHAIRPDELIASPLAFPYVPPPSAALPLCASGVMMTEPAVASLPRQML